MRKLFCNVSEEEERDMTSRICGLLEQREGKANRRALAASHRQNCSLSRRILDAFDALCSHPRRRQRRAVLATEPSRLPQAVAQSLFVGDSARGNAEATGGDGSS